MIINYLIKENKNKIALILVGLFLLTSWFYWFQWRPVRTRSYCNWAVQWGERASCRREDCYDYAYKKCLHEKGL